MTPRPGSGTTFIDGNNVMGGARIPVGRDERDLFLDELLKFKLPKPSCLVFDGPPPGPAGPKETSRGGLRIVYAAPSSADAVILKRLKPGDAVVTSDFALQGSCRAAGGRVFSRDSFLAGLRPTGPRKPEKPSSLSPSELEAWMDVFRDVDEGK